MMIHGEFISYKELNEIKRLANIGKQFERCVNNCGQVVVDARGEGYQVRTKDGMGEIAKWNDHSLGIALLRVADDTNGWVLNDKNR